MFNIRRPVAPRVSTHRRRSLGCGVSLLCLRVCPLARTGAEQLKAVEYKITDLRAAVENAKVGTARRSEVWQQVKQLTGACLSLGDLPGFRRIGSGERSNSRSLPLAERAGGAFSRVLAGPMTTLPPPGVVLFCLLLAAITTLTGAI
jgi:hypothetical protein